MKYFEKFVFEKENKKSDLENKNKIKSTENIKKKRKKDQKNTYVKKHQDKINNKKDESKTEENKSPEGLILNKEDFEYVRGNPARLIIKNDDIAKKYNLDERNYVYCPKKEEINSVVEELSETYKELDPELLKNIIHDLYIKQEQYLASFDLCLDKISKYLLNELELEGNIVYLDGAEKNKWRELKQLEKSKFVLREIQNDKMPEMPYSLILSKNILKYEIFSIVSDVTGISYETLIKDLKKIEPLSTLDVIKNNYNVKSSSLGVARKEKYALVVPIYTAGKFGEGALIHEIAHLEDTVSPKKYREGIAILTEINGTKRLAQKRKDIGILTNSNCYASFIASSALSEYLKKNELPDEKIICVLKKMGLGNDEMNCLFGDNWKDGRIDKEKFKSQTAYFARAYEIAKYFGEDIQTLKISLDDWKEFLKTRDEKDWKKLYRNELKADIIDYGLENLGGFAGLGLSRSEYIYFIEKKKEYLKTERSFLLHTTNPKKVGKINKVLKRKGILSKMERLDAIEEELAEADGQLGEVKNDNFKNIKFNDLIWRIKKPL